MSPTLPFPSKMLPLVLLGSLLASAPVSACEPVTSAEYSPLQFSEPKQHLLESLEISATRASIEAHLASRAAAITEAEALIAGWREEQFALRQQASNALFALPYLPKSVLEEAMQDPDFEVRSRAHQVLQQGETKPIFRPYPNRQETIALLSMIHEHQMVDCFELVVELTDPHVDVHLKIAGTSLLAALAAENHDSIERLLSDEVLPHRTLVYQAALQQNLIPTNFDVDSLLTDDQPAWARLILGCHLINQHDQRGFPAVISVMLDDSSLNYDRLIANRLLQDALGEQVGQWSNPQWQEWLENLAQLTDWTRPVELTNQTFENFQNRIQLFSCSFLEGNSCGIFLDGNPVIGPEGSVPDYRGFNIVAVYLDEIILLGNFDTHGRSEGINDLAQAINDLPDGTYVAIAVADVVGSDRNRQLTETLRTIGGNTDLTGHYRSAYYCIGCKGLPPGSAIERCVENGGPIFFPPEQSAIIPHWANPPVENRQVTPRRIIRGVQVELDQ